jgi:hypothetical protein
MEGRGFDPRLPESTVSSQKVGPFTPSTESHLVMCAQTSAWPWPTR